MHEDFAFGFDGATGSVHVECVVNNDPDAVGTLPHAAGFPVCTATVEYPRRGYRSMLGWVQLVRSTDNASGGAAFEMDPFALFGDAPSPYCWYGTQPTLFDAPSRPMRAPMCWVAHSFLATTRLEEVMRGSARWVEPLTGFAWGFEIRDERIELFPVAPLTGADWDAHLPVLAESYPFWRFRQAQFT